MDVYPLEDQLEPTFSFNKMAFEIHKLLGEKAVASSTIQTFYLRRTTHGKRPLRQFQRWIDEEKKKK